MFKKNVPALFFFLLCCLMLSVRLFNAIRTTAIDKMPPIDEIQFAVTDGGCHFNSSGRTIQYYRNAQLKEYECFASVCVFVYVCMRCCKDKACLNVKSAVPYERLYKINEATRVSINPNTQKTKNKINAN